MPTSDRAGRVRALLVGTGFYPPHRLPDGSSYPALRGAAADAERVRGYLRDHLKVPDDRIAVLKATATGAADQAAPPEPEAERPTYENLVAALGALAAAVGPGDPVLVYYSGHGGRVRTGYPELKGRDGLDETLVPWNVHDPSARHLRDMELAALLRRLTDRGADLTVVLDCCHSGGATRGAAPGAAVRGRGAADATPRPTDSLVAPREDLLRNGPAGGGRGAAAAAPGAALPYTLLAACQETEEAREFRFDGYGYGGVMTYWLLDALRTADGAVTYGRLHDRLVAKVHTQFETQTPVLVGDRERRVFGGGVTPSVPGARVLRADPANGRLLVQAGQAHGLSAGARLAVYPADPAPPLNPDDQLGEAVLERPGATESWAEFHPAPGRRPPADGDAAVVTDPGPLAVRRRVRVLAEVVDAAATLAREGCGLLVPAGPDETADFQVATAPPGFTALDSVGNPLPYFPPVVTFAEVARRLAHVAKFRAVREIDNPDRRSPLFGRLAVEVTTADGRSGAGAALARPDEVFRGVVRNNSTKTLHVAVLGLRPTWDVLRLVPGHEDFFALEPGQSREFKLRASLPGAEPAADVLKVFAATGRAEFRWLCLPPLGESRKSLPPAPEDPLEELWAALTSGEPGKKVLRPSLTPERDWTTASVEVLVRSPD